MRHVRDLWSAAYAEDQPFQFATPAIGNLLVTRREYTIRGEATTVPGHIGIITALGEMPTFIHASPVCGKVEERPLRRLNTILGSIAICR
jgi:hypothetical protein